MQCGETISSPRSPAREDDCDCEKNTGRWQELPHLSEVPSVQFLDVLWPQLKTRFGFLPTGIKIPLRFLVTASISGRLECACPDEPECSVVTAFSADVSVIVVVPVSIEILGAVLRLVPYLGQAYAALHIAYVSKKVIDLLGDVAWAFEPVVRVIRESSDLICQGRFDHSTLMQHVLDIASTVDL